MNVLSSILFIASALYCDAHDSYSAEKTDQRANTDTLRFVHVIWRHGDRSPSTLIPSDTANGAETWPQGLGELTDTGAAQQFELGQWLRKRYDGFIDKQYKSNQIYIRSSDYNRTLMSAQWNLAGMYPPGNASVDAHPASTAIPIHTVRKEDDIPLYEHISCPSVQAEKTRLFDSHEARKVEREWKSLLSHLATHFPRQPFRLSHMWFVFDPLNCQSLHPSTHSLPQWVNASTWSRIVSLYDIAGRIMYKSDAMRRLRGGPLLSEIVSRLNTLDQMTKLRYYAYSAHDTTLASLLATLHIHPTVFPLYATAIMLELHERGGRREVEVYYKNITSSPLVYRLHLPTCSSPCTLEGLTAATRPYTITETEWKRECGIAERGDTVMFWKVSTFLLAVLSSLLAGLVLLDTVRRRGGRKGKERIALQVRQSGSDEDDTCEPLFT